MRIVFSTDWYSEGMGYFQNLCPSTLARRGHKVFVVSSTMQVYGDEDFYHKTYEEFLGPPRVEPGEKMIDGVKLIRLPIILWWRRFRIVWKRNRTILNLKPDIVYAFDPRSYQALALAFASFFSPFRLFTANHTLRSVYPVWDLFEDMPLWERVFLRLKDTFIGWLTAQRTHICYAPTPDAAEIAVKFFGVPEEKVRFRPLGLDTNQFHPSRSATDHESRAKIRAECGVGPDEMLCIYTGRFTEAKNPYCLAEAVGILRSSGSKIQALFLGEGIQETQIRSIEGCRVRSFVPYRSLNQYYWAADVGVWPREESVSALDAAACGLPLVVSDRIKAVERIEGNGLTYRENDAGDLATVLSGLEDVEMRLNLGRRGAERMANQFGIEDMVDTLLADFESAIDV